MGAPGLFGFESGYAEELQFMPIAMRYRLDLAGLKVGLEGWRRLPLLTRSLLLSMPAGEDAAVEAFREALLRRASEHGLPAPQDVPRLARSGWSVRRGVPARVRKALAALSGGEEGGALLARLRGAWSSLGDLQRYALLKLSGSRREPDGLARALAEFLGGI